MTEKLTDRIRTEEEHEELLSRPSGADVETMRSLDGDLLILGAAGKMGPSLARLAQRAVHASGKPRQVIAVSRFSDPSSAAALEASGIRTIACDLLAPGALNGLPEARNVIYMAARKFGTTGGEYLTWAMNAYLPGLVAERFRHSRIVSFSTGNVYPLRPSVLGGAVEDTPPAPDGEYGQSALARERMFEYGSHTWGTPVVILRLNYACELRYGVLVDIAKAVREGRPVSLGMGLVNVIWQGDANSICLRSLEHAASPPRVWNLTGPETLSVRYLAQEFGRRFGVAPVFQGEEAATALLSNSVAAQRVFGYPTVPVGRMIDWVAAWIEDGHALHAKPTHFQVRDGKF